MKCNIVFLFNKARRCVLQVKTIGFLVLDFFFLLRPFGRFKSGTKQKLLWIKTDATGDFIIWSGSVLEQGSNFPKHKFEWHLACDQSNVAFAEMLGFFDNIHPFSRSKFRKNPFYRAKTIREIGKLRADFTICPVYSRDILVTDSLVRASASAHRIGWNGDLANCEFHSFSVSDKWYTQLFTSVSDRRDVHEIFRHKEFASFLGSSSKELFLPNLKSIYDSFSDVKFLDKEYYVIFPGSGDSRRNLPAAKFAEIGRMLSEKFNYTCVIGGAQSDIEESRDLESRLNGIKILNLCGKTNWKSLGKLIQGSKLVISNDSGPAHLTFALSIPLLCFVGGGTHGRFFPYPKNPNDNSRDNLVVVSTYMPCFGCNWKCTEKFLPKVYPCVDSLNIPSIEVHIDKLLSSHY